MSGTIDDVTARLPSPNIPELPAPPYTGPLEDDRPRVALAVEAMRRHTSSEGWEIMAGLESAGYLLAGHRLPYGETDVPGILAQKRPGVVFAQDEREWQGMTADRRLDPAVRFRRIEALRERPDVFVGTILKDAHQRPDFHRASAERMGAHFWVVYYHPQIVKHLAPYVRSEHLIRTYHSVAPENVPPYQHKGRRGCLLSGALSSAYPLRMLLARNLDQLPDADLLKHPGYHQRGAHTPEYLRILSRYKVAICTVSRYAYCLKKIIEATAAGCMVITDLPVTDRLPAIDCNLVRVEPCVRPHHIGQLLAQLYEEYDPERQEWLAHASKTVYDWRAQGVQLALSIEAARRSYQA